MKQADPPAEVYRLGRRPDPWAWPDWAYAEADATFGNRYDDPQGIYRVLYASTQRVATFVECLAYYRADIELVAEMHAIVGEEGDEEPPAAGVVPASWVEQRCVGRATLVGDYADVGHHESLAELRTALAARVVHHRLHDLDAGTIRLTAPRAFTQDVSRYVFSRTVDGQRRWNGLAYLSKHGDDLQNWAIFEPAAPEAIDVTEFDRVDADLASALALHGLQLG
ncbi:MAG: RES domain-containing protein [Actinobacteria bacterium]|nr:RES domain-containing protein [Actinomycetota bacterium]